MDNRVTTNALELLDSVGPTLDEARAKIEAVRDRLLILADADDDDSPRVRDAALRLDNLVMRIRVAEEVASGAVAFA